MRLEFDQHACFGRSYEEARELFRRAASASGGALETYENPNAGPDGRTLTTDVARFGRPDARAMLIVVSGTHGNEARCGSGCQVAWLREGGPSALAADAAVLLVHCVNPYGAAFRQRETEEGVDLNRNFVDHAAGGYPRNEDYVELHEALTCPELSGPRREAADAFVEDFRLRKGEQAYLTAFASGQYTHPTGLYFGGHAPAWANRTFRSVVERHAGEARRIAVIDIHTGFGPYGYGMLLTTEPPAAEGFSRARRWYGESLGSIVGADATRSPPDIRGSLMAAVAEIAPEAEVTPAAIEFGTYELSRLIALRRAEAALKNDPAADPEVVESYRRQQQEFLIPDAPDWTEMVWARARQVIRQALAGLVG